MSNTATDQPCREIFSMLAYRWDITAALALVEGREPNASIGVTDAARWLPLIVIDQGHAATVDLNKPVLVVAVHDPAKPGTPFAGYLTIDGWHRIHRATQEDVATLPAHLLTAEEEKQIRLSGGDTC
ncbi:hypothetical protein [Nonomuraea wenchangensis]|uniref:hypothetical protein n=1 Tax=Nonomuraea wenchangensis TaxID=568860 RepID=UPI003322EF3A